MNYDLEKMGKSARTVASVFRIGIYFLLFVFTLGGLTLLIQTIKFPIDASVHKNNNTLDVFVKDTINNEDSLQSNVIKMSNDQIDEMIKNIGSEKAVNFVVMEDIKMLVFIICYFVIYLNLLKFLSNGNIKDPFNMKSIKYIKNVIKIMTILILFPVFYDILETFVTTDLPFYNTLDMSANIADYFKYYLLVYILILGTKKLESNVKSKEQKEEK